MRAVLLCLTLRAAAGGSGWGTLSRLRGGESAASSFDSLVSRAHREECDNTAYYTGACAVDYKPPEFETFALPGWTLPDFGSLFDSSRMLFVTKTPMFSREECRSVVEDAEAYFAERGGWTKLPSGRFEICGFWIKDVEPVAKWFNAMLKERLFPTLHRLFPDFVEEAANLIVESSYLFKYSPETGGQSDVHTDSGCLSFTILLNDKEDFDGGGTWFDGLENGRGGVVEMDAGHVTLRPGGVRHQGHAITRGVRYVIGGFMMCKQRVERVRLLLNEATKRSLAGDFAGAEAALREAVKANPRFDGTYTILGNAQLRQGRPKDAKETLRKALECNGNNSEALYTLGVIAAEDGNAEEATRYYEHCLRVDANDVDAIYDLAELKGSGGDVEAEMELYRRLLRVNPSHAKAASAHCNLGVALGEQGRLDEEIAEYEAALAVDAGHFQSLFCLGSALGSAGRLDDAIRTFQTLLKKHGTDKMDALKALYRCATMKMKEIMDEDPSLRAAAPQLLTEMLAGIMGEEYFEALRSVH